MPTFVLDREHRVLIWNRACEELTGVMGGDIIGTTGHSKIFYQDRPCLADVVIDGATEELSSLYPYHDKSSMIRDGIEAEGAFRDARGRERCLFLTAAPIRNSRGELTAAIESLQDITKMKRMEARLRHAQKMEAIGTLAAGVAHDFNTILTAVYGYGNLLRTEVDLSSALARDCLKELLAAAERGTAVTRSLLTYSCHVGNNRAGGTERDRAGDGGAFGAAARS